MWTIMWEKTPCMVRRMLQELPFHQPTVELGLTLPRAGRPASVKLSCLSHHIQVSTSEMWNLRFLWQSLFRSHLMSASCWCLAWPTFNPEDGSDTHSYWTVWLDHPEYHTLYNHHFDNLFILFPLLLLVPSEPWFQPSLSLYPYHCSTLIHRATGPVFFILFPLLPLVHSQPGSKPSLSLYQYRVSLCLA